MKLNEIRDNKGAHKHRVRVGRGIGSGKGKTCGRGVKGQKSRSGVRIKGFEGGQMPLHMRLPKQGFTNIFRKRYAVLNLGRLQAAIDAGTLDSKKDIDAAVLVSSGVIRRCFNGVRLLAKGELTSRVKIHVAAASQAALAAVEKAGGSVTVVLPSPPRQAPSPSSSSSSPADQDR